MRIGIHQEYSSWFEHKRTENFRACVSREISILGIWTIVHTFGVEHNDGKLCESLMQQHNQSMVCRTHSPSQGPHVRKRNTTEKSEATSNEASKSGSGGSLCGHATRLKIQSRKITKPKNENGAPVPEGKHIFVRLYSSQNETLRIQSSLTTRFH